MLYGAVLHRGIVVVCFVIDLSPARHVIAGTRDEIIRAVTSSYIDRENTQTLLGLTTLIIIHAIIAFAILFEIVFFLDMFSVSMRLSTLPRGPMKNETSDSCNYLMKKVVSLIHLLLEFLE